MRLEILEVLLEDLKDLARKTEENAPQAEEGTAQGSAWKHRALLPH